MKKDFFELPVGDIYPCNVEVKSNKNKVFSACVDVNGIDAGTIYICADSLENALLLIRNSNVCQSVTYVGGLRENSLPAKYWPSETFTILGVSEGLLFSVDEKAEEAAQVTAEIAWKNEQMEVHFEELNKESSKIIGVDNIIWVKEPVLINDLPVDVTLTMSLNDFENNEANMEEYLLYALSEIYVFTPISIGGYKVLS